MACPDQSETINLTSWWRKLRPKNKFQFFIFSTKDF